MRQLSLLEEVAPLTPVASVAKGRNGHAPHVRHNSGNDEWYTPPEFLDAAHNVMGGIDTDPASSDVANTRVRALAYYTLQDDGLRRPWRGRVWMNPPYSRGLINQFCAALRYHREAGRVTEAITLTNNATETAWFADLLVIASAICLVSSRIKFLDRDGNRSGSPLQGQIIVYSGPNVAAFEKHYSQFGKVIRV